MVKIFLATVYHNGTTQLANLATLEREVNEFTSKKEHYTIQWLQTPSSTDKMESVQLTAIITVPK